MSAIAHEVASQPACWRRAAEFAGTLNGELGESGARVAFAGCGTSLYVARAIAVLRETTGRGETDAFAASEFPNDRRYDRVVAISRSGTTTEVLQLLERLGGTPRAVITADGAAPAASRAEASIVLDFAEERSVVQTRFATSVLALVQAHLDHDLAPVVADAERALTMPLEPDPRRFDHVAFLGSPDPTVADDVASTGATVRVASLDPMAELVLVHRTAIALAEEKGLDPDHPRHLTRSVVLP